MLNTRTTVTKRGYVQVIWTDPDTGKLRREYLHRLVWQQHHGPIPEGYVVHHKDGNPQNNAVENLELRRVDEHTRLHNETDGRPPWTWQKRRQKG